jgi:hypothetical protein
VDDVINDKGRHNVWCRKVDDVINGEGGIMYGAQSEMDD